MILYRTLNFRANRSASAISEAGKTGEEAITAETFLV